MNHFLKMQKLFQVISLAVRPVKSKHHHAVIERSYKDVKEKQGYNRDSRTINIKKGAIFDTKKSIINSTITLYRTLATLFDRL